MTLYQLDPSDKTKAYPTMKNRGNRPTGLVDLRNLLTREMQKVSKEVDQVVLATVKSVSDTGKSASVLIDGFKAGNINVGWALATRPSVGQRVTMIAPAGGQEWYVVGILSDTKIEEVDTEIESLTEETERLSTEVVALRGALRALTQRVTALENG